MHTLYKDFHKWKHDTMVDNVTDCVCGHNRKHEACCVRTAVCQSDPKMQPIAACCNNDVSDSLTADKRNGK